jgi:hypothetical protein
MRQPQPQHEMVVREFKKRQINATGTLTLKKIAGTLTLKKIATQKGISPSDLYEIIKEVAKRKDNTRRRWSIPQGCQDGIVMKAGRGHAKYGLDPATLIKI